MQPDPSATSMFGGGGESATKIGHGPNDYKSTATTQKSHNLNNRKLSNESTTD